MTIDLNFHIGDFERYFKVSAVLYTCFALLVMILILSGMFNVYGFLLCLPVSAIAIFAVLISLRMYQKVCVLERKALEYDELKKKFEARNIPTPILKPEIVEPEITPKFDIVKVQQCPETKQEYKASIKGLELGEIIEL